MDLMAKKRLLAQSHALIGKHYNVIDCSHFVNDAYKGANMPYPYLNTSAFVTKANKFFKLVGTDLSPSSLEVGDVIVFNGHMGIWDPEGCLTLGTNQECKRLKNDAPFLSSRSGQNRGPDFGRLNMWSGSYSVYRWIDKKNGSAPAAGLIPPKAAPFF